ncbi:hypothetical protein [Acinetobacter baumannii]
MRQTRASVTASWMPQQQLSTVASASVELPAPAWIANVEVSEIMAIIK